MLAEVLAVVVESEEADLVDEAVVLLALVLLAEVTVELAAAPSKAN